MNFRSFIKDKFLLTFLIIFGILTIEIFLIPYKFGNFIKIVYKKQWKLLKILVSTLFNFIHCSWVLMRSFS